MEISLIAAVSENNVIGNNGNIPWKIPEDMKRFRDLTLNHPVIMGRKTFYSIIDKIGKPLEKRDNIVLSRNRNFSEKGVYIVRSIKDALAICNDNPYVIGGESVYREFLSFADRLEITKVHKNVVGDTFFPEVDWNLWKEFLRTDNRNYSFITYLKR